MTEEISTVDATTSYSNSSSFHNPSYNSNHNNSNHNHNTHSSSRVVASVPAAATVWVAQQSPAGALLLQAHNSSSKPLAPDRVFREYTQRLVDLLESNPHSQPQLDEAALSLLNAVTTASLSSFSCSLLDSDLLQSIRSILQQHSSLQNTAERKLQTEQALQQLDHWSRKKRKLHDNQSLHEPISIMSSSSSYNEENNNKSSSLTALDDHVSQVLIDLGPSCTRSAATFRQVLQELLATSSTSNSTTNHNNQLTEASMARLLFFLSSQPTATTQNNASNSNNNNNNNNSEANGGLSTALLSSLLPGNNNNNTTGATSATEWNMQVVAQVLSEDYGSSASASAAATEPPLDWNVVAESLDFPGFCLTSASQFCFLLDLYRAGAGRTPPLSALAGEWRNTAGQYSVLECVLTVPPSVFLLPLDEQELADAQTAPPGCAWPNPQGWASRWVLNRLLYLSDVPSLFRRVRDLFVKCLLQCPEVLLCSLVRLQLRVTNNSNNGSSPNSSSNNNININNNAGLQLKQDVMRELIPLFFRPQAHPRVQNGPAALRRLYAISPPTVVAACLEAWRSTAAEGPTVRLQSILHIINIARLLPSPTEAVGSLLSSKDVEFSFAMAFVMADHDYLQLKVWLTEKFKGPSAATVAVHLMNWIRTQYPAAAPRADPNKNHPPPLTSLENVVTSLQLLRELDPAILHQSAAGNASPAAANDRTLGHALQALIEAVVQAFPSLRAHFATAVMNTNANALNHAASAPAPSGGTSSANSSRSPSPGNASSDDVEEMATQYFQNIYTSKQSIGEIVEMLKRFKTSGNSKENEIFACMVHNLFDEYRFFSKYPEKELRITGILFGALIQEQLVSSITLGIALRYVLEALRKPPAPVGTSTSSGKMFKFGMFALEQFKARLHEWPQYCSHIVQIPHLKENYRELVAEIEQEMAKSQKVRAAAAAASGTSSAVNTATNSPASTTTPSRSSASTPTNLELPKPRVAEFGKNLGRAVNDLPEHADEAEIEAPPDTTLDRVQFMINNMAPSNVEQKANELKEMLDQKYFGWLGQFLVVKRISTQANFHSLYLSFLDYLGDYGKGLVEAIIKSAYHNIGKLLRSPKITTSSSERSYLKNLGIWLGQITLARNRPILQIMLDCKELLLQGYETGKLIAVAPFLAKTLEGAKNSVIFRPPNPWLMGILGVFRSVYNVDGLKMNIKFEVEVLCKNLGIKLEDICLADGILARRIAPTKERNPDFNIKSSSVGTVQQPAMPKPTTPLRAGSSPEALSAPQISSSASVGSADDRQRKDAADGSGTVIPNLAAYVTVNPSLPQLLQSQGSGALANLSTAALKRCVPIAVDKAIREIIQPVVERSVTIACITTKEIVTKDFAMESDEMKMRKAGQLMVANLAGSLALVTCREPLRSSVSQHLRRLLTESIASGKLNDQEQNVIEQCVQICATDNLELGCMLIEKAATEKAVKDVDEALGGPMNARRSHREQTGQPFYDMSIFQGGNKHYPAALPEQLQPKPGGLRSEHFQLYESFQRLSRPSQVLGSMSASSSSTSSGGLHTSRSNPSLSGEQENAMAGGAKDGLGGRPSSSADTLSQLAAKLDAAVTALLSAAGSRAPEVKLSMLPADHQIRQLLVLVKQIMPNAGPSGNISRPLTTTEQDMVLGFSQGIFKRLYELSLAEPLRLEALVALLESINMFCPKLGKDMGTWATYAPTNTEQQRRLHRTVLLLLVRSRLLSVPELDNFLAARTDNGRSHIWVEFSLLFIRTAFMERISTPSDFPKLIDLMSRIVEGKSQATSQVVQAYRKPILRMLEETGSRVPSAPDAATSVSPQQPSTPTGASRSQSFAFEEGSSLSNNSLAALLLAGRKVAEITESSMRSDPANARHQVAALLDGWIRLQSESNMSEKSLAQFLQVLQQIGVGKVEENTERFLRLSTIVVIDAVLKSTTQAADGTKTLNHSFVDMYARLLVILFRHMNSGGSPEQVAAQRLGVLNKILGSIVRSMMWHFEKKKAERATWDQRPWFRLLMNLVMDINKPDPAFESIRLGILSVFGSAFHVCQPLVMPGFAFAWLELVSHRHFMPNVMLYPQEKGWHIMHQLLIDHFLFMEPYLSSIELTPEVKKLYEGTLRVLLVLLHDFPSFLSGYHLSFCNVVPDSCVQLRNIILSATPKGMNPPDPFTPNLKIDLLADIGRSPTILSSVLGPIEGIRGHLDGYMKDSQRSDFLNGLLPFLYKEGSNELHVGKVNSLVLYVGAHAIARLHSAQFSLSRTPEMEVFLRLMELDDKGRYICLNAMANQLRFPSSHTHYFSCVMLYLFSESKSMVVKEQVTRVLLERLIVNRPHPWGLLITFIELIKNQRYGFWNYPFTRCATEIERVFESVARSCMQPKAVGGDLQP